MKKKNESACFQSQPMAPSNQNAKEPVAPLDESPYGKEPEPGKAPEAIARTVAAMPPEQMFKLMVTLW